MGDRHYTPPGVADYMARLAGFVHVAVDPHVSRDCGMGATQDRYEGAWFGADVEP